MTTVVDLTILRQQRSLRRIERLGLCTGHRTDVSPPRPRRASLAASAGLEGPICHRAPTLPSTGIPDEALGGPAV
jgi:hypothetical protein